MQKQKRLTIHDLHKIERRLMREVGKYLKVQRRLLTHEHKDWVQLKRVLKVTYKGDPQRLKRPFEEKGFEYEAKVLAEAKVVRLFKCFQHMGLQYTARIAVLPEFKRMSVSLSIDTPKEAYECRSI